MKKNNLIIILLFISLISIISVSADNIVINYPRPNDIISESNRIRLNVTSDVGTSGCYFSYDNITNQSVDCNGVSLVDMPNADETYRIRVTDDEANFIDQQLTIIKPKGSSIVFIYIMNMILISLIIFLIIRMIAKLATFETNIYDVSFCLIVFFLFLFNYQISMEYINTPFLLDWLNIIMNISSYLMIVFPLINYFVCAVIRSFKKKNVESVKEINGTFRF